MNLLGKLTWSAIPFDQPIVMGAAGGMILGILFVLGLVTVKGYWPALRGARVAHLGSIKPSASSRPVHVRRAWAADAPAQALPMRS